MKRTIIAVIMAMFVGVAIAADAPQGTSSTPAPANNQTQKQDHKVATIVKKDAKKDKLAMAAKEKLAKAKIKQEMPTAKKDNKDQKAE